LRAVFRLDASPQIGMGHLMRCLSLALQLKQQNIDVSFICREVLGGCLNLISEQGFQLYLLQGDFDKSLDVHQTREILEKISEVDFLIVDHYDLDAEWESQFRSVVKKIIVIDDLANRQHDCDYLIDQNFYLDMAERYQPFLNQDCKKLLGPKHALLRSQFYLMREMLKQTEKKAFVCMGGGEELNLTEMAVKALLNIGYDGQIDVVLGPLSSNQAAIEHLTRSHCNISIHHHVSDMATLMASAELAIGAGGSMSWERCCLGLPSIVVSLAENQERLSQDADKAGVLCYIGSAKNVNMEKFSAYCERFLEDAQLRRSMSAKAMSLVDGLGCRRVANELIEQQ